MRALSNDELKEFIEKNVDNINNSRFDILYDNALFTLSGSSTNAVKQLTEVLFKAGINPLLNMKEVPDYFLFLSEVKELEVPDNIEGIGASAFCGCKNLTKISLPKSLKYIDNNAFALCPQLRVINLPNTLEVIGQYAFQGCSSLKSLRIPKSVRKIEHNAFYQMSAYFEIIYEGSSREWDNICHTPISNITFEG